MAKKKPRKPYPSFPLYAHATGRWAKTVRGKTLYFGPWSDPDGALKKWLDQEHELRAGRKPRSEPGGRTIADMCNRFLIDKRTMVQCGELQQRSWNDYKRTAEQLLAFFGRHRPITDITTEDFGDYRAKLAETRQVVALGNEIGRVRVFFNYVGPKNLGWLDSEVVFGPMFRKPSRKSQRIHRAAKPSQDLPASVIRSVLESDIQSQLKAMVYLGINCALGNQDCALIRPRHLDLAGGWLSFPRPKTGIERRSKLWPETVYALHQFEHGSETVFTTRYGNSWEGVANSSPISLAFRRCLKELGEYQSGRGFYSLRRTFQTQSEECGDFPAIAMVMGHSDDSMAARYRQRISDQRLERVADTVRDWSGIGRVKVWPERISSDHFFDRHA